MGVVIDKLLKRPLLHDHGSAGGDLLAANNLSDLDNISTARTNLGLVAGGAGDIWVEKAGDTMSGLLDLDLGLSVEGGSTLINQLNGNHDFKVGGSSLDGMIWVRSGFDRVGFGVSSVDNPFHVGLASKFTTTVQIDGLLTTNAGITNTGALTQEGGAVLINQANGAYNFKVGGNSVDGMIWVRQNFDRVGFNVSSVDYPYHFGTGEAHFVGTLNVENNVAFGGAGLDSSKTINVDVTHTTTSGDKYGFNSILRANPSGASSSTYFGGFIQSQVSSGNGQNLTGGLRGAKFLAQHNGTGTVTNAFGSEYQVQNTSTGTITTAIALNIGATDNTGGGSIGTAVGLKIGDMSAGTAGRAIEITDGGVKNAIEWAGDTNLYRSAANTLKTDDKFDANTYAVAGAAGATGTFTTVDGKTVTVTAGLVVSIV